jgi:hypothetical protein
MNEIIDADIDVRRFDVLGTIVFEDEIVDGEEPRADRMLARIDERTGFLVIDSARTARTGVQIYGDADGNTWGEYRPDEEVFAGDSLASLNMNVLTNDHPAAFVTAANVRDVQVGHTGADARRDGRFVVQSITVTDADTIREIKAGKRQLSRGYFARLVQDRGVADGQPFTVRQTNIRGNHLAIVDRGRAGPDVGIPLVRGDAFHTFTGEIQTMKTQDNEAPALESVVIDGETFDVPPAVAARLADAMNKPFGKSPDDDEEEDTATRTKSDGDVEALRAKLDALEAEAKTRADSEATRIDARVNLVTVAREVLGADAKTDGVSDAAIMRAVIVRVNPALEGRLDANASSPGYVRASFDACVDLHRSRVDAVAETNRVIFDAMNDGADAPTLDAEYSAYLNRYKYRPNGAGSEG